MNLDDQYYMLTFPKLPHYPELAATKGTIARHYSFEPLIPLSNPVVSYNYEVFEEGKPSNEYITYPLIMVGMSFIVTDAIKKYMEDFFNLTGMRFHPAVYKADEKKYHENYWYLNIFSEIDCWDREKSEYDDFLGDDEPPSIEKYVLNATVLNEIEEDNRLIFRMGWDSSANLFIHQRVIDYFEESGVTGYRAIKVSDYEFGMEF